MGRLSTGTVIPEHIEHGTDNFVAIVPSDTAVLTGIRQVYVGGAGALVVTNGLGVDVTFAAVPAGTKLPISPSKIKATGTTATAIVALK